MRKNAATNMRSVLMRLETRREHIKRLLAEYRYALDGRQDSFNAEQAYFYGGMKALENEAEWLDGLCEGIQKASENQKK